MRLKNSFKNMVTSIFSNLVTIIIGLIAQAIFLKYLGTEFLGLNSLFSNVISLLSIVEMGLGSAIIFNLYKPIANNDVSMIKSLLQFYKKSYYKIATIILLLGIIIIPFLRFFVNIESVTVSINVYIVYLLFLGDTILSYLLSYKRSILYANQKNYIINLIHIFYTIFMNLFQILIIIFTRNYYLYLIIKLIMRLVENLIITLVVNKMYSFLNEKDVVELSKNVENDIFKKIKALFFHKIGGFFVLGTDNIIISKFLGLSVVGLYSNYYLIINSVKTVFDQVISSTTASVGNLLATENKDKQFEVFKKIRFLNFWISTFASSCILIIMDSFIIIWIGAEFLLPLSTLIILVINFYFNSSRATYVAFKDAAGIYYEDRFVPIIESFLNIVISLICCNFFGLTGVFIGTFVSGLSLWCFSYPKYVYKNLFDREYYNYIKETIGYLLLFIAISFITYLISLLINVNNIYLEFLSNIFIGVIIPNLFLIILFWKNENFKYYLKIVKSILRKV